MGTKLTLILYTRSQPKAMLKVDSVTFNAYHAYYHTYKAWPHAGKSYL